ncbi:hypothetical protein B7494_g661 [Chlorociboria aeruginascens]|nr:hypothetical protein B7494_g661 [Chlorociboria aeruginascens]
MPWVIWRLEVEKISLSAMNDSRTSGRGATQKDAMKATKDNGVPGSKSKTGNAGTTSDISSKAGEDNVNYVGFFENSVLENEAARVEEFNASHLYNTNVQNDRIQYPSEQSVYADTTVSIIPNNGSSYTDHYNTICDRIFSGLGQASSPSQHTSRHDRSTNARNIEYESTPVSPPQISYADLPQDVNGPTPLESWNYTYERHESIAYRLGDPSGIPRYIAIPPAEFYAEKFGSYPESEH